MSFLSNHFFSFHQIISFRFPRFSFLRKDKLTEATQNPVLINIRHGIQNASQCGKMETHSTKTAGQVKKNSVKKERNVFSTSLNQHVFATVMLVHLFH